MGGVSSHPQLGVPERRGEGTATTHSSADMRNRGVGPLITETGFLLKLGAPRLYFHRNYRHRNQTVTESNTTLYINIYVISNMRMMKTTRYHHHQKAFRNKSHTSHGHRPGLKKQKQRKKINY